MPKYGSFTVASMWIDDFVKKGIDKSLNFVKQVTRDPPSTKSPPIPSHGGQYVSYTLREAPVDPHTPFPDACNDDHEENMFSCDGSTVGEVMDAFPVPAIKGKHFQFRFKSPDENFGYVWMDRLERAAMCPQVNGQVAIEVLVCPGEGDMPHSPKRLVQEPRAPPIREDLVRQRQEREAAQIQAARDFAEASAKAENDRRQNKLDVQSTLGPELDKWAFAEPGKFKDVRSLLSSMESVLWPNSGWETVAMGELMINDTAVKKLHRKAIILCHPDRHQQATAEQQYRADRIFNAVNESYKVYTQK